MIPCDGFDTTKLLLLQFSSCDVRDTGDPEPGRGDIGDDRFGFLIIDILL